jgi:hypothetical protein
MTYKSVSESIELYKDGHSLTAAAAESGVSTAELTEALRSHGVELREDDRAGTTSTRY